MKESVKLGLSQLVYRQKIMVAGPTNTGKSVILLKFVLAHPKWNFFMIDPDCGVAEIVEMFGGVDAFPNLEYRLCGNWAEISTAYQEARGMLKEKDWLLPEHMGRWWDMCQDWYTQAVYEQSLEEKVLASKVQSENVKRAATQVKGQMLIGGLAAGDWTEVRRQHNAVVYPMLRTPDRYNVLATSDARDLQEWRKNENESEADRLIKEIWHEFGFKPGGEKHLPDVFSHIFFTNRRKVKGKFSYFMTPVKFRGVVKRLREMDVTDAGLDDVMEALKNE